jgi:hypothetical protein
MFTLSTEETAEFSAFAELSARQRTYPALSSIRADPRRNAARCGSSQEICVGRSGEASEPLSLNCTGQCCHSFRLSLKGLSLWLSLL